MKMMTGPERERWEARNLRENAGYTLKPGDRIKDVWWQWSTVTRVTIPANSTVSEHGHIAVVYDDGTPETYAGHGWEAKFRVERA